MKPDEGVLVFYRCFKIITINNRLMDECCFLSKLFIIHKPMIAVTGFETRRQCVNLKHHAFVSKTLFFH